MKRLLYGGSFDPVHTGHVEVARAAGRLLSADRVEFVPAALSPHKQADGHAGAEHRLAMLRLATEPYPELGVVEDELERGGVSYTVDTVRALAQGRFADDSLILLVGQDSVPLLPSWRSVRELAEFAPIAVAPRDGAPDPDWDALRAALGEAAVARMRALWLPTPRFTMSSSAVRRRRREGRSIRCWVPDPVADYVEAHGLYA